MKGPFDSITLTDDLCEVHRIYTVQDLGHYTAYHCTCSPAMVTRYQRRSSGLLLDRFDTHSASKCPAHLREYCELAETSKALMRSAMNHLWG